MSYKQTNNTTLTGTQEVNLEVNRFDAACDFLHEIGLKEKSYQETKRESWKLGLVQIEMDTWPWLGPILELEGPDEHSLRQVAEKLALSWEKHMGGGD